jgi:alpha-glucosidase
MDIVPNHCSDQHPWFQAAVAAEPGSDERGRFYFRDGRDGGPPNNWGAAFGGSAWTSLDGGAGQWYLGTFTPYQPDFDHEHPDVQTLFADVLRFWADRGVEGFRVDAVHPVGKAPGLPDAPPLGPGEYNPYSYYRPEGHAVWRRWRQVLDAYTTDHPGRDLMMIAEAYGPRHPELIAEYTRPDEFHQCFSFDLMLSPWHAESMRRAVREAFEHVLPQGNWPTFALNNHDAERVVTRLGTRGITSEDAWTGASLHNTDGYADVALGTRRARAAAGLLLGLPGSTYVYQGEEIGLPEVLDLPDELRQDPTFHRTGGRRKGRDGCRIPLPWTASGRAAHGFSIRDGVSPWLPQPADWGRYAFDQQEGDDSSMLALYRRLIAARREHLDGTGVELLATDDSVLVVQRGENIVACNTGADAVAVDAAAGLTPILATDPDAVVEDTVVPGDCTVWFSTGPGSTRR